MTQECRTGEPRIGNPRDLHDAFEARRIFLSDPTSLGEWNCCDKFVDFRFLALSPNLKPTRCRR